MRVKLCMHLLYCIYCAVHRVAFAAAAAAAAVICYRVRQAAPLLH